MKLSRADRSLLAEWSFTVDRGLLAAFLTLIALGVLLSFAASPAIALKKGLPTYYFVERHVLFSAIGCLIMFFVSLMSPVGIRRLSAVILLASIAAMCVVMVYGINLNGAQRWLSIGGYSLQPSEFAKPAFIVLMGWLYAEASGSSDMPALPLALLLWAVLAALLVAQPDVGQTILISTAAGLMYLLAGLPLVGAAALAATGAVGLWLAYENFGHVQSRLEKFFSPMPFENFQVSRAIQSFSEGGFFGRGPGEGTIKSVLPDAHTDFIFAVIGEEYGVLACIGLVGIYAFVLLKVLRRAAQEPNGPDRLAMQGLAIAFSLQALINMGVNIGLVPPKGMTLPFISAGGSSTLALSITAGMLLALTRWRPDPARLKKPRLVPTIDGGYLRGHTPAQ